MEMLGWGGGEKKKQAGRALMQSEEPTSTSKASTCVIFATPPLWEAAEHCGLKVHTLGSDFLHSNPNAEANYVTLDKLF